jgi:MoxR-like ATPase
MEEHQVTAEGETRPLPEPFFVIATQNPMHQVGTFPLPESQLDRFLMRISLGYPDAKAERELLRGCGSARHDLVDAAGDDRSAADAELQKAVPQMQVSDALLDYVQQIINHTRHSPRFTQGLSPARGCRDPARRAGVGNDGGRRQVLPEDVQAILPAVVGHRLHGNADAVKAGFDPAKELIGAVPIP